MIRYLILLLCTLTTGPVLRAQDQITFRHLNTSNGLSYLGVSDMCTDQKGNLWIGTGNGLNMFNGRTVEKYFATEYPELQNSNVIHVACDKQNRIWVLTANGHLTIIDEKRKFHRAGLYDQGEFLRTRWILNTGEDQLLLFTSKGHFMLASGIALTLRDSLTLDDFTFVPVDGFEALQKMTYRQVFYFDDEQYLFVRDSVFFRVNYKTRQVEKKYTIPGIVGLTKMEDGRLLAYDQTDQTVKLFDLSTEASSYPFHHLSDQHGMPVRAVFRFAEKMHDGRIILTTEKSGLYIYDPDRNTIHHYQHHYADGTSLGANITSTLCVHPSGWVFITCNPSGLSYFDSKEIVYSQTVFSDENGRGYDGYIAGIATADNQTYYIGTAEGLLEWNRNTNLTRFLEYHDAAGQPLPAPQEIFSIVVDELSQVWVATRAQGVIVLDRNRQLKRHITNTGALKYALKMDRIQRLQIGPEGHVWVCGRNGLCRIDPKTFEVDHFENSPLAYFDSLFVTLIQHTDDQTVWLAIANGGGIAKCNLRTGEVLRLTTRDGLVHNGIFDLGADEAHNLYVGTRAGLNIIYSNGRIKTLTQKDGLIMDRAEGLLRDRHGRMWIGNDIGLACYTPADSSLRTFDTRHGLSVFGFRVGSYFQMSNGEFVLGTPHGIQYFDPEALFHKEVRFTTLIHKIESRDIVSNIAQTDTFHLSSADRQITFHFSTIDFSPFVRTYYEYKLEGLDPQWIRIVDQHAVRYNTLPPGSYTFKVRVSHDNRNWLDAENEVFIRIATPFYQQWWFILSGLVILLSGAMMGFRRLRQRQTEQREQLETEAVIHYFGSRIHRHKNVNEMLWDVAKNCISKLQLEECVIYLLDPDRQVLVQTAAYGPKNPEANTILQPLEIPVGKGITGTVARTGSPEIVNNTRKDPRYIVDDMSRQSEIAVPILIDDRVIGVIDSEHSQKNHFTPKHMSLLTAISVLTANQIQRIKAEEDRQKAEIEMLQNKQKATESRLQSLRLQMNPHFLFNALNSIQQMILANEEMVATKYLSRFSKLLRSILIHSDKESITLREELDILKLYVELESVRFKEAFTYSITCDEDIDTDEVKIPTLLIQPFVENAIWHGLMHKEGQRHLLIRFTDEGDHVLCVIEDNGIGREKARELKIATGQDKKHTSKGIEVSLERLKAMQKNGGPPGTLEIIDLTDDHGHARGTRVEIYLPIQN